jgi:hypothetical protein
MDRISVRGLATAIRLIREPVVVTYSYPRSHPLYGAGEESGVFIPMAEWRAWQAEGTTLPDIDHGAQHPANADTEFQG